MAVTNEKKASSKAVYGVSRRDPIRGVWELARLHTREAFLCWFPAVWGACLSAGTQNVSLDVITFSRILFGIWSSVTASHCTLCTFNDICDRNLDLHVERCKTRPLPSGMLTLTEAILAFIAWIPTTVAITYFTLGEVGVKTFIPIWILSIIYPFMKRIMPFPQVVLGATMGAAVFPGWAVVTNTMDGLEGALPLFGAVMAWVVYFDIFYATQDRIDDAKVGVKSLAVLLGDQAWIFLSFLGMLQVGFFAMTAMKANMSAIFWGLGVLVWAGNIPWHITSLDVTNSKSGGKIFKANITLGLWMTAVALLELVATHVHVNSLTQFSQQVLRNSWLGNRDSRQRLQNVGPQNLEKADELQLSSLEQPSQKPIPDIQSQDQLTGSTVHVEEEDETEYPSATTRSLLMLGISCSAFLVALDRTIVSTAIPTITDDFNSPQDAGWYGSAYLLTSCACQPTFGRVFSHFDTRWSFLTALGLFELGSLICGAAPNSTALIVGRAIAGLGCAGVFAGCLVIITLCVPLAKRPIYMAGVGGIFGVGSILGPIIGGVFTEKVTWRLCFYINLPVGAITVIMLLLFFHPTKKMQTSGTFLRRILDLDLVGNGLLISSIVMLLLALQWGGIDHPWNSATTIGLLVGGFLEFGVFIAWQIRLGPKALVPPHLVVQRTVAASLVFSFFISGAVLVHTYYVPYWFQAILNVSAERSGVDMIPYVLGNFMFSIFAGVAVQKTGYVLPAALLSPIIAAIGSGFLVTFDVNTTTVQWAGFTILAGAGIGIGMQQGVVAVQAVLVQAEVPIGTALILFIQSLSGAIFVSVGNALLRNQLSSGLTKAQLPGVDIQKVLAAGATTVHSLIPAAQLAVFQTIYNSAIQKVFILAVPLAGGALFGAVFIEWRSLKGRGGVSVVEM
ncbi:hypothetical protein B7494_g7452 [Chlorociboria aeruginascens]|nr:hypothetical protein B7494_g7452 [Chlorociboria aeruginascens]